MSTEPLPRLGFLGGGKMATALIQGLLRAGLATPERVTASDVVPPAREALHRETGIVVHDRNVPVVEVSDVLIVAVKPQNVREVLEDIRDHLRARHLVISVAAGITLVQLLAHLHTGARVIRVMPNTPCLVGASASAYCLGSAATPEDRVVVERMLNAVGVAMPLPEKLFDAVTGLSGSGPAFVAVMIEALSDGGVRMGLPRDVASALAAQTVLGTAKMVLDAKLHPALLKDMVASPAGTTIAGLHAMEHGGVRAALIDAVEAATRRATELGAGQA